MRRRKRLNVIIAVVLSLTMTTAVPLTAYGAENEAYVYKYSQSVGYDNNRVEYANGSGSTPAYLRYVTGPDGSHQQYGGYCADFESTVVHGSLYSRTSIGEATHFSDSVIGHLRAILANSVPVKSLASLKAASGVSGLDYGEAVAATQWAIWAYTNPGSPEIAISSAKGTSDKERAAYYLYNLPSKGATYATEPVRINIVVSQSGSKMIFDYSSSVNIGALKNKVVTVTDATGKDVPFTDSNYKVIADVSGLNKNQTVSVTIEGTQTLAADAYFYDPKGGRMASQSLISWFSGETIVAGSAFGGYKTNLEYTEVALSGDKTLHGRGIVAEVDNFVFLVKDAKGNVVSQGTSDADGNITFAPIKFYKTQAGRTFNYVVVEQEGNNPGMTYDASQQNIAITVGYSDGKVTADVDYADAKGIAFVNEYTTDDTELALQVSKELTGDKVLEEGMFEFVKVECDEGGNPLDEANSVYAVNDADGKVVFPADVYSEAGVYFYLIKEVNGGKVIDGITYDAMEVLVEVTVTDNLYGELTAEAAYPEDVTFDNCYEAAPVKVALEGVKNLEGRALKDGEFTFVLYNDDGVIVDSVTNGTDGTFRFEEMEFEYAGEYKFTVSEEAGELPGVTYDDTIFEVTVVVTDDGKGQLQAEVQYPENGLVFENTYVGGKLIVTKTVTVEGEEHATDANFFVALFTDSGFTEMTEHGVCRISMNGEHTASIVFENLEYGVTYYVAETDMYGKPIGSGDYGIRSVIILNGEIEVSSPEEEPVARIINDYADQTEEEEDKVVKTGDEFNTPLFAAAMLIAAIGMLAAVFFRRRES